MTLILVVGSNMKFMMTLTLYDTFEQNIRDKIYIWISEPTNVAKYIVGGNNNVYFSENGREKGIIQRKSKMNRR